MNFKRFHESKNLFDTSVLADGYHLDTTTGLPTQRGNNDRVATLTPIDVSSISAVTLSYLCTINDANFMYSIFDANDTLLERVTAKHSGDSIDVSNAAKLYIAFYGNSAVTISSLSQVMLNTGSTPLPYEPYSSEVWHHIPHYIHNTSTDTLTTLPADIYANDTTATVGLKGQMEQSSTPSTTTPIQPQECGDRTGNLFDKDTTTIYTAQINASTDDWEYINNARSVRIPCEANTTYTISVTTSISAFRVAETASSSVPDAETPVDIIVIYSGDATSYSFTTSANAKYIIFQGARGSLDTWLSELMLNLGSTALPYEPYGIKIPILSNSTTTPVYLGEVQSTRQIKKLVLDGTEAWTKSGNVYYITSIQPDYLRSATITTICTHYQAVTNVEAASAVNVGEIALFSKVGANQRLYIGDDRYANATEFTAYLAQQYANGTPVCVWYVLATPQTAVVNEPLRKIGNYADTVSDITIPTIAGANTLSVDTTLQPSEVTATYKGWHSVADVHERESGAWT